MVTLSNSQQSAVAFKFKTNAPEKYLLKPIVGKIEPGKKVTVTGTICFIAIFHKKEEEEEEDRREQKKERKERRQKRRQKKEK